MRKKITLLLGLLFALSFFQYSTKIISIQGLKFKHLRGILYDERNIT